MAYNAIHCYIACEAVALDMSLYVDIFHWSLAVLGPDMSAETQRNTGRKSEELTLGPSAHCDPGKALLAVQPAH